MLAWLMLFLQNLQKYRKLFNLSAKTDKIGKNLVFATCLLMMMTQMHGDNEYGDGPGDDNHDA